MKNQKKMINTEEIINMAVLAVRIYEKLILPLNPNEKKLFMRDLQILYDNEEKCNETNQDEQTFTRRMVKELYKPL